MSTDNQTILKGVIEKRFPIESLGNKGNWKRKFWLAELKGPRTPFPQSWELELWHDDINDLDGIKDGDAVQCKVFIRGHHWARGNKGEGAKIHTLVCVEVIPIKPEDLF